MNASVYEKYSGDFSIKGTFLRGRYNNDNPWRADYDIALSGDGNTLTMTSRADISAVSTYVKMTIPETIKNAPEVRSGLPEGFSDPSSRILPNGRALRKVRPFFRTAEHLNSKRPGNNLCHAAVMNDI